MADGDFRLIAANEDIIDLNSLTISTSGVQAIAGLTGFGLPQVEVQYQVGAGDGATFRGSRLAPRDIDVPLLIAGEDRNSMRTQMNRLASALAGECRLQWEDGGDVWELKVRRVGGGEFVYGTDTDGHDTLQTVVTLRAGDPLWRSVLPFTLTESGTDSPTNWIIPPDIMGSAKTWPTIYVAGPTSQLVIANDWDLAKATAKLTYTQAINSGEWVAIDMEKGTVRNQDGANRYGKLAPNPRFFSLQWATEGSPMYIATDNTATVKVDIYKRNWLVV